MVIQDKETECLAEDPFPQSPLTHKSQILKQSFDTEVFD